MDRTRTQAVVWLTGRSRTWRVASQRTTRCTRTPASYSASWTCPWPPPPSSVPTSLWEPIYALYTLLLMRRTHVNDIYIRKWYTSIYELHWNFILMQTNMTQGQRRRLSNGLVTGHAYSVTGYAQVNGHVNMIKFMRWQLYIATHCCQRGLEQQTFSIETQLHFGVKYKFYCYML